LAKIAVPVERALARRKALGMPGQTTPRTIASGDGWMATDVVCTAGPDDRPFEEAHTQYTVAIVLAGTFQYRSTLGRHLMTPGSLLLGNPGQRYECGHEHGEGDRCVSFWYAQDYLERVMADVHPSPRGMRFNVTRLPPLRRLSPLVARAAAGVVESDDVPWEEIGVRLAVESMDLAANGSIDRRPLPPNAEARVTSHKPSA
jgi:AraC family transcriptional regulator